MGIDRCLIAKSDIKKGECITDIGRAYHYHDTPSKNESLVSALELIMQYSTLRCNNMDESREAVGAVVDEIEIILEGSANRAIVDMLEYISDDVQVVDA